MARNRKEPRSLTLDQARGLVEAALGEWLTEADQEDNLRRMVRDHAEDFFKRLINKQLGLELGFDGPKPRQGTPLAAALHECVREEAERLSVSISESLEATPLSLTDIKKLQKWYLEKRLEEIEKILYDAARSDGERWVQNRLKELGLSDEAEAEEEAE